MIFDNLLYSNLNIKRYIRRYLYLYTKHNYFCDDSNSSSDLQNKYFKLLIDFHRNKLSSNFYYLNVVNFNSELFQIVLIVKKIFKLKQQTVPQSLYSPHKHWDAKLLS